MDQQFQKIELKTAIYVYIKILYINVKIDLQYL